MANTEGMSDESVLSLAESDIQILSASARRLREQRQRARQRERQMKKRFQHRVDLPIGSTPAAKIIRKSPNDFSKPSVQTKSQEVIESAINNGPNLVGDIIEHYEVQDLRQNRKNGYKASKSLFRNRQSNTMDNSRGTTNSFYEHLTGFPSVHNAPIGTFVKNTKNSRQNTVSMKTKDESLGTMQTSLRAQNPHGVMFANNGDSHSRMKEASQKESETMMAAMSLEEIKDHQEQIKQVLSPSLLSFLKNRRRQTNAEIKTETRIEDIALSIDGTSNEDDVRIEVKEMLKASHELIDPSCRDTGYEKSTYDLEFREGLRDCKEKERISSLLASIQTHEELDAAYEMEMKSDVSFVYSEEEESNSNVIRNCEKKSTQKQQFLLACDLLRSSSPRQMFWAVKTVSSTLGLLAATKTSRKYLDDQNVIVQAADESMTIDELPTILPVSLRCILDTPLNSSCSYNMLHTYALQSLYFMTIIHAHEDYYFHIESSTSSKSSMLSVFQDDFMEDDLPTSDPKAAYAPIPVRALEVEKNRDPKGDQESFNSPIAYSTLSSNTSAITDGNNFVKDPMWTLLSKMKILPRISSLLEHQHHLESIPAEGLVATCGILSMVAQRSPGAASAIAQHKTILSMLVKRMLREVQKGYCKGQRLGDDSIVLSTLCLLCTLARQSRVAAQKIPLEDILPPLISAGLPVDYPQFRSQQLTLVLWRTVLRYGLGLEALASMLAEAGRHFALSYTSKHSLSSEFLSCFAEVLGCIKVIRRTNGNRSTRAEEVACEPKESASDINFSSTVVAELAIAMLRSTLPHVFKQDVTPRNRDPRAQTSDNLVLRYRWNASRLRFLSAWLQTFTHTTDSRVTPLVEHYSLSDYQENILSLLQPWVQTNGDIECSWRLIAKWCDPSLDPGVVQRDMTTTTIRTEAAACSFIGAYFTFSLFYFQSRHPHRGVEDAKQVLREKIFRVAIRCVTSALKTSRPAKRNFLARKVTACLARERWINQCHFSVTRFCIGYISMNSVKSAASDLSMVRNIAFPLLGRLQIGNESMAAVLFSSDVLFQPSDRDIHEKNIKRANSPISSLFLSEICGSQSARIQLDHSFKLQKGFGITSAGLGPFALASLLSTAEKISFNTKDKPGDEALPLGRLWLWHSLSGSIKINEGPVGLGTTEAVHVITAALDLILDLEGTKEMEDDAAYASRIPLGSKLYYLMNICLHPEEVLRDERISTVGADLLDTYLMKFGSNDTDVWEFCQECLYHSGHNARDLVNLVPDDDVGNLKKHDRKLLDEFAKLVNMRTSDSTISVDQTQALLAFLEDLTAAYRDYGAQYDFFTKCIRIFLLPIFPTFIRCRALKELESMFHLLTLSSEACEQDEMTKLLSDSIIGGLPDSDHSVRDDVDLINAVTRAASAPRIIGGYMQHYCVGILARSFAISLSTKQGIEASKVRIKQLNFLNAELVCKTTKIFLDSGEGTKESLINAILSTSVTSESETDQSNASCRNQFFDLFDLLHAGADFSFK